MNKFKNVALAAVLMASASAHAGVVTFDVDGDGVSYDDILVSKFNLVEKSSSVITQYLGDDGILNDGDLFEETIVYQVNSAKDENDELVNFTRSLDLSGLGFGIVEVTDNFTLTFNLFGYIDNFSGPVIGDGVNDANEFLGTEFDVIFDMTPATVTMTRDADNAVVGVWDVLSGGAGSLIPGPTVTQTFDLVLGFAAGTDETVFGTENGISSDLYSPMYVSGIVDTSGNPVGLADNGAVFGSGENKYINIIPANSNNAALRFEVPEPTSLAILGLGLLGLAGVRRRA